MDSMAYIFLLISTILTVANCLPPHERRLSDREFNEIVENEQKSAEHHNESDPVPLDQLGLEYTRYLQQIVETLESDPEFKKKLENAEEADIRTAKIAEELDYVNHHVRSKLDELKRTELQRLRELAKQAYGSEHDLHLDPPGHVDHENAQTFEIKDLKKLIYKVAEDLEDADKKRKEMFKNYEMQKHFEREQKLQNMTEEERKRFLSEEEANKKREHDAAKTVHHPGSKQQLEEVWEQQDHMNKNDFDPKTFFVMHDVDNNGFLDEEEVKSLFLKELDKLYSAGMPQADLMERAEEMERMREHVFKEVDKNRDRLISWEEFHAMSLKPEFNEDPGWQPLENQQIYSPQELQAFEKQRLAEIERLRREGHLQYQVPPQYHDQMYPHGAYPQYHQPGMQQQHPGMQQQHPGMQQQHPGMQQQHPAMQQQHPAMQQQHPGVQQHPAMQQAPGSYQQVPSAHQQPQGIYQQPPGVYQQPPVGVHPQQPYAQPQQQQGYAYQAPPVGVPAQGGHPNQQGYAYQQQPGVVPAQQPSMQQQPQGYAYQQQPVGVPVQQPVGVPVQQPAGVPVQQPVGVAPQQQPVQQVPQQVQSQQPMQQSQPSPVAANNNNQLPTQGGHEQPAVKTA